MDQQKVEVDIFGHTLRLRSDADPEYASRLAAYVDEQIRKVSRQSNDPIKVVILASMNIANEVFEERKGREEEAAALEERANLLIQKLEQSL